MTFEGLHLVDIILRIFLAFSSDTLITPILILGFIAADKRIFGNALVLVMFTMIYNYILKCSFQSPTFPGIIHDGYDFPSGHMHAAFVLYGWLFLQYKNVPFRYAIISLLIIIGYGLIYFDYHTIQDVLGSVFFGMISLFMFNLLNQIPIFKNKPYTLAAFMTCTCTIMFVYVYYYYNAPHHVWMAITLVTSFTISWTIYDASIPRRLPIRRALLAFFAMLTLYFLLDFMNRVFFDSNELQWFIAGILFPLTTKIAATGMIFEREKEQIS